MTARRMRQRDTRLKPDALVPGPRPGEPESPRRRVASLAAALACCLLVAATGCQTGGWGRTDPQLAAAYLEDAEAYLDQGLTDSALAAFGLALEENPNLTSAHKGMGGIYRERGEYELASRAYERATRVDPTDFEAHYYLGLMKQLLGELRDAIRVYLQALAINPDNFQANRDIASAYLQIGRPFEALSYAERATRLEPTSQPAWANLAAAYSLLGRHNEAVDAYRQAAELGEPADPVLLGLASAHIRLGNYDRAANVLESLIRRSPSATAHERLGLVRFKQRQFDDALEQFETALELNPDDTAALNGVGVALMTLYIQDGRNDRAVRDRALEAWRRSLRINREQPKIIDLLARYRRI